MERQATWVLHVYFITLYIYKFSLNENIDNEVYND